MEKSGLNLNEIDTTDCDMSLVSLQVGTFGSVSNCDLTVSVCHTYSEIVN